MKALIEGIKKFHESVYPEKRALFEKLAVGQNPTALLIACADSRVEMQVVTQSEPGQLFVFRNAGNIVPPFGAAVGSVTATIEYAMVALKIPHIIVCGHSDCGAMKGLLDIETVASSMPTVARWLEYAEVARALAIENDDGKNPKALLEQVTHENIIRQIEHLETHPSVAVRLARGEVELHGWYYDIGSSRVTAFDAQSGDFLPVEKEPLPHATIINRRPRPYSKVEKK